MVSSRSRSIAGWPGRFAASAPSDRRRATTCSVVSANIAHSTRSSSERPWGASSATAARSRSPGAPGSAALAASSASGETGPRSRPAWPSATCASSGSISAQRRPSMTWRAAWARIALPSG